MVIQHYKPIMLAVFLVFGFAFCFYYIISFCSYNVFCLINGELHNHLSDCDYWPGYKSTRTSSVSIMQFLRKSPGMSFENIIRVIFLISLCQLVSQGQSLKFPHNLAKLRFAFLFVITLLVLLFLAKGEYPEQQ
jgi:hypothetical protein